MSSGTQHARSSLFIVRLGLLRELEPFIWHPLALTWIVIRKAVLRQLRITEPLELTLNREKVPLCWKRVLESALFLFRGQTGSQAKECRANASLFSLLLTAVLVPVSLERGVFPQSLFYTSRFSLLSRAFYDFARARFLWDGILFGKNAHQQPFGINSQSLFLFRRPYRRRKYYLRSSR